MDEKTIWCDLGKEDIDVCIKKNRCYPSIENQQIIIRLENLINEITDEDEYFIMAVKTSEDGVTKFYNTGMKYQNNKMFIDNSEVITGLFYEIN